MIAWEAARHDGQPAWEGDLLGQAVYRIAWWPKVRFFHLYFKGRALNDGRRPYFVASLPQVALLKERAELHCRENVLPVLARAIKRMSSKV